MSFTTVTVTGKYLTPTGAAEVGTVAFTLSAPIMDAAGKVIRSTATATATLDSTGAFSLVLPANDDAGTVPTGTTYSVVEQLRGGLHVYSVVVPHTAAAGTVDITALAPVSNTSVVYGVTSVNGMTGAVTVSTAASGAGLPTNIRTITTSTSVTTGDFALVDATAAARAISIVTGAVVGALVIVKKTDTSANAVTVTCGGTIDGDANATITSPQFGAIFEHVGSENYKIVAPTSAGGSNGVAGKSVLSGAGAPGAGTGTDGEFYIDTTAHAIYGPKAAGAWGSSTSLIGAAGSNGTNGAISLLQDEGSNLTVRPTVNFVGAGVTASDDAGNNRTVVTVTGGAGGGIAGFVGDGSDGTVTFDGSTAVAGFSRSGTVYTAARDVYYTDATINAGVRVFMNAFVWHNNGTLTIAATAQLDANGNTSTSNAGGATWAAQTIAGSSGAGGNGANPGVAGTGVNGALGGAGGAGGVGSVGASGAAGAVIAPSAAVDTSRRLQSAISARTFGNSFGTVFLGGAGGGGGGNDNVNQAGGGGGGGGVLVVNTKILVNNGTISANGGKGANASATGNSAGGGGGGGLVFVNTTTAITGTGTITASGGALGTGNGTGTNGTAGSAGTVRTTVWA